MANFQKNGGDKFVTPAMIADAKRTIDEYMENAPAFNGHKYKGRGIVMVAGGTRYLPCAYVCVKMVRANGCSLPIEIWHLGAMELDATAAALFDGLGVEFVDCMDVLEKHPCRRVGGWEMNPYAIIHSQFREVFFLDADNIPLIDLEKAFEWDEYKHHGAVFWPDYGRLHETRSIWKLLGIQWRDEAEFESGQILIDKRRCWRELQLTMCLNEHSDTYYAHVWGDKETYHMAWRYLDTPYAMVPTPIYKLKATMCQHDFSGKVILQHRNMDKFSITQRNSRIRGFQREDECFAYLAELKSRWNGNIDAPEPATKAEKAAYKELADRFFNYQLNSRPGRELEFLPNGTIGRGAMTLEQGWYVMERPGGVKLYITGRGVTAVLQRGPDGSWVGRWLNNEMYNVVLVPVAERKDEETIKDLVMEKALHNGQFIYSRTGFDRCDCTLTPNNKVVGAGTMERAWWIEQIHGVPVLFLAETGNGEPICMLQKCRDGIWRGYWTKYETMHVELIPKE